MNYRCLTCGFAQDFQPTSESVALHHPWMGGLPVNQCPACTEYLKKHGGRKPGKIRMPDITEAGVLESESTIADKLSEMNRDFHDVTNGMRTAELKKKYGKEKLFGWTIDELDSLRNK